MKPFNLSLTQKTHREGVGLISLIILLILSLPLVANPLNKATDFSGSWTLNEDKSVSGDSQFRWAATKMVIRQSDDEITLEKTVTGQSGQTFNFTENITLDGKECENMFNDLKRRSTAVWAENGEDLIITTNMSFNGNDIHVVEIYKKSGEGNDLIIDYTSSSSRGERKRTLVYDKEE